MTEQKQTKIKVIKKNLKTKEGKPFMAFSYVNENGRLVDLRMKRDVNINQHFDNDFTKYYVTCNYFSVNNNSFEYPRVYIGEIVLVEPIV